MSDLFVKSDVVKILRRKSVLLIGDSIMRNLYKDLVWFSSPRTTGLIPRYNRWGAYKSHPPFPQLFFFYSNCISP